MPSIDPTVTEIGSPIWALAQLYPPQGSWSSEEYLQLDAGRLIEFEDGSLEIHAAPTAEHQRIVLMIYRWLFAWSQQREEPGEVFVAPLPIRLWAEKYREPDVVWIKPDRPRTNGYPDGADLVVEVLSSGPESRKRDLVVKAAEYAKAGIPEYWIVDYEQRQVHVGKRSANHYDFVVYTHDQIAVSHFDLNLSIAVSDLDPAK